jgi:hypothetical protein
MQIADVDRLRTLVHSDRRYMSFRSNDKVNSGPSNGFCTIMALGMMRYEFASSCPRNPLQKWTIHLIHLTLSYANIGSLHNYRIFWRDNDVPTFLTSNETWRYCEVLRKTIFETVSGWGTITSRSEQLLHKESISKATEQLVRGLANFDFSWLFPGIKLSHLIFRYI